MADNERNFSDAAKDASPDVTLKVTDEQLSHAANQAREYLKNVHEGDLIDDDGDALSDTRAALSTTSIGGFVNFLHRNFLPDLPDRDKTQATILLDNTRSELNLKLEESLDTTHADYCQLPKLSEVCEVKEAFAGGGQGVISRGLDKSLHRSIAIKSLRKEILDKPVLRKAFITEAMITAQLEHPAIIPIHGLFGDDRNGIHQAMKLVRGHTLKEELQRFITMRRNGKIRISQGVMNRLFNERIELLLRICDAVAYAHSRNIIHCDLKPENIMIGEYGEIYVMDWGLARRFRDNNGAIIPPQPGAPLDGTPRYMPAEVFLGKPRDERTDIFALGLILFEMITLRHGYNGKTIQEVIQRIKNGQRNPIVNRFGYTLNPDLVAIVDKATAYLPEMRYQHVTELAEDLRCYLDGLAVSARPENFIGRFFRNVKRYSRTLVLMTLVSWLICGIFITQHLRALNKRAAQELEDERAYNEQQLANYRQLEFEKQLLEMDAKVIGSASELANALVEFASDLRNISINAGMLLSNTKIDGTFSLDNNMLPFIFYSKITPQSGIYSPVYDDHIEPMACSYQVPPGRDPNRIAEELARLRPIAPSLKNLVTSSTDLLRRGSAVDQMTALIQDGVLIRRAYLALDDTSLHLAYPGSGNYGPDYDNHTRPWYYTVKTQAMSKGQLSPQWSKPYLDHSNSDDDKKQMVITCSIPIFSPDQTTFLGVAAFDLFFETFSEQLRANGNAHDDEIIEKYLCSAEDGTILCYVPVHPLTDRKIPEAELEATLRDQLSFLFVSNQNHISGNYGHYKTKEHDHWVYFHYAYIPALKLYLIEKTQEDLIFQKMEKREKENSLEIQASIAAPEEDSAPPEETKD
ncbi:MAG: protein kinase [Victivallales bacterium]|nr:protein kinase [Victivallales bacterium]